MKITKAGKNPEAPPPSWIGKKLRCPNCKTEFILEEGDAKKLTPVPGSTSGKKRVRCPHAGCRNFVIIPAYRSTGKTR